MKNCLRIAKKVYALDEGILGEILSYFGVLYAKSG